ncbi:hypothetical protein D917_06965 [Trichinella nativa]|uniref:Uncharacterized protein n=1 Tax=Trichinella nativa TaxID=6335 RepID=A0A1Y3ERI6_9BILA|nr:hypothetical protein D917_06965 [Trichinella nativa]
MAQEDAGIKAAERQRKTRKYQSIESWPPWSERAIAAN